MSAYHIKDIEITEDKKLKLIADVNGKEIVLEGLYIKEIDIPHIIPLSHAKNPHNAIQWETGKITFGYEYSAEISELVSKKEHNI